MVRKQTGYMDRVIQRRWQDWGRGAHSEAKGGASDNIVQCTVVHCRAIVK